MPSVADMYRDILPAAGADGGLTSRKVRTVPVDSLGNPLSGFEGLNTNDVISNVPAPSFAPGSPTLDATNPIDLYRLGLTPQAPVAPAVAAIESAAPSLASMFGSSFNGGWGSEGYVLPSMNQTEPNGMPIDSDRPLNMNSGGAVSATGRLSVAPTPPPPKTPLQTLADMFTPAKQPKGFNGSRTMTSNDVAGGSGSIFGENAVLPPSMNNERWNTGYN